MTIDPRVVPVASPNVAYFFVPLPEPVGLPDGYVVRASQPSGTAEWLKAEQQNLGAHRVEATLGSSLRFWQRTVTVTQDLDPLVDVLFDVAYESLPGRVEPPAGREAPPTTGSQITVVEMAVPVEPFECDSDPVPELSDAFDEGMAAIRYTQRALQVVTRRPLTLVTRETLPVAVPFFIRQVGKDPYGGWPDAPGLFLVNINVVLPPPVLDSGQLGDFEDALQHSAFGRPALKYLDLVSEARLAMTQRGDYRAAVVLAATAAETLLDDLVNLMLWEEGLDPAQAAKLFDKNRSVVKRVANLYRARIGGPWDLAAPGVVSSWKQDLADLRNRVVHGGVEPSLSDCTRALDALGALGRFVGDRLTEPTVISRYPRTALLVIGKPELMARGTWSPRVEQLIGDPHQPQWIPTFARWRDAVASLSSWASAEIPNASRSILVAVAWPDGAVQWWLHDREAKQVIAVDAPDLSAMPHIEEALRQDRSVPESIAVIAEVARVERGSTWVPAYSALPLTGVMCDGSDLERAADLWHGVEPGSPRESRVKDG